MQGRLASSGNEFNWIGQTEIWSNSPTNWPSMRHELFTRYEEWSIVVAKQIYATCKLPALELNDYIQCTSIGLLEAIDKYDPALGVPFKSYAYKRLKGEVLTSIVNCSEKSQSIAWQNKCLKERVQSLESEMASSEERDPEGKLIEGIIELTIGFILENEEEDEDLQALDGVRLSTLEFKTISSRVFELCENLPDDSKTVMLMHYRQSRSFTFIAEKLNVSLGRVSQIHASSIKILRKKLRW